MLNSLKPFQRVLKSLIHFAYPPLCLHCGDGLINPEPVFCESCAASLEMIHHKERCLYCFTLVENTDSSICSKCRQSPSFINRAAAVFDYVGPAATLVSRLKYSDMPYLAKGMGAYLAAQFMQLEWPMPDVIVPAPIMLTHLLTRGYNQSELIAQALAELLGCPVQNALSRRSGDYSQAGLSRSQRLELGQSIYLKEHQFLHDKCILLVDDVLTTGSTIRRSAQALLEGYPKSIYALTFCRAI